ncbi:SusE domain-containing protein [Dysgonomonas termitidis]|uniref:SusE domain-containing protein n=1 Tax=Dysgonomonas termitidis TaxID=1516126 RepID=A0ABV9L2L2_9BACT
MQKQLLYISILFLAAFYFAACSDDDKENNGDALSLKASSESIVLDEAKGNDVVVFFTWNKGKDPGQENTLVYFFRLDIWGADFKTSTDPIEFAPDAEFKVEYTNKELNDLILNKWGQIPGSDVKIQARVVAKVIGPKFIYPEISIMTLEVKSYVPTPETLYLTGDATPAGTDLSKAIKMTEAEAGNVYQWQGVLKPGYFKFISILGESLPSLNKGAGDNTLINRALESEPDNMFGISTESIYNIEVRKDNMTLKCEMNVPYPNLYLVGNAGTGWGIPQDLHKFTMKADNHNLFELDINLNPGEFKILSAENYDNYTLRPMIAGAPVTDDRMQANKGGEDLKWVIKDGEGGHYRITLDIYKMKIKFEQQ